MIFSVDKEWKKRSYSVMADGKVDEDQRKELEMRLKKKERKEES